MRKAIVYLVVLFVSIFPQNVLARNYGEGSYGLGNYNEGEPTPTPTTSSSSTSSNSTSSPDNTCHDQSPGAKTPWLYGAIAQDSTSVLLYFTEADNPVTKYVLTYGTKSGEYQYGVDDLHLNERGQMTYLVKSLTPNTTYYFKIRGQNGCATGEWSNEISTHSKGVVSFNQLEFTESKLSISEEVPASSSCQTYSVKSGDSLWDIAKNLLGDGGKYISIIDQNKNIYPSLETSTNLNIDWKLQVNCLEGNPPNTEDPSESGYQVKVKVVGTDKKPVVGAKVTIHSTVQESTTDQDGIAKFTNVEPGDHKVIIAYKNYEGEQSVNLAGTVKEFGLNITVEQKPFSLSPLAWIIIGIMGLIIIGLGLVLARRH